MGFKIKEIVFKSPGGTLVDLNVPSNINQSWVDKIKLDEYFVKVVATGRAFKESEVLPINLGNTVVGYIIPGQALLSQENSLNGNAAFGAYSLIAALHICRLSFKNDFSLAGLNADQATSAQSVFLDGLAYAVIWGKKLAVAEKYFEIEYFVSLCKRGLYLSTDRKLLKFVDQIPEQFSGEIRLSKNKIHLPHIRILITKWLPAADNGFLRFFYVYQLVEMLMSESLEIDFKRIREELASDNEYSFNQLKNCIKSLQTITKEDARINRVLQPACNSTLVLSEKILNELGEPCGVDMTFADKIYQIRNIVIHDCQRLLQYEDEISELSSKLLTYIYDYKLV